MRLVMKLLAPLLFWFAYALFRSPVARRSKRAHDWIMKLFRIAAEGGSRRALSVYGHLLHFRGEGVSNRIQGAIYLQRAADKGDLKALYQMGRIHEQGYQHQFPPAPEKALEAYRRAAEAGHPLAVKRMVELYRDGGLGVTPDAQQMARWQERQPAPAPR
jgi:TPR repeat protein